MNYTELYVISKSVYNKYKTVTTAKELHDLKKNNNEESCTSNHPSRDNHIPSFSQITNNTRIAENVNEEQNLEELENILKHTLCKYQELEKKIKINKKKK